MSWPHKLMPRWSSRTSSCKALSRHVLVTLAKPKPSWRTSKGRPRMWRRVPGSRTALISKHNAQKPTVRWTCRSCQARCHSNNKFAPCLFNKNNVKVKCNRSAHLSKWWPSSKCKTQPCSCSRWTSCQLLNPNNSKCHLCRWIWRARWDKTIDLHLRCTRCRPRPRDRSIETELVVKLIS